MANSEGQAVYRVLHAGFHKTGSTFLQKHVFPNIKGVCFVPDLRIVKIPWCEEGAPILFSNEASCGYPYPITEDFSVARVMNVVSVLGVDRVFVVEREFYSWVLSLYFQTLNEGRAWTLSDFISINGTALRSWQHAPSEIKKACNKRNIEAMVFDYDQLLKDRISATQNIVEFVGGGGIDLEKLADVKENASRYGIWSIGVYRRLNILMKFRLGRILFNRLLRRTPRRLISGKLGAHLDRRSPRSLTPNDVKLLLG